MRGRIQVPFWPGRSLPEQARITSPNALSMRSSQRGSATNFSSDLRSDRCSRNSSVNSTMRGSVLHHRIGWPSLNHGKMPAV